jgi:hypothetical protein
MGGCDHRAHDEANGDRHALVVRVAADSCGGVLDRLALTLRGVHSRKYP